MVFTSWEARSSWRSAIFCRMLPSALGSTCPAITSHKDPPQDWGGQLLSPKNSWTLSPKYPQSLPSQIGNHQKGSLQVKETLSGAPEYVKVWSQNRNLTFSHCRWSGWWVRGASSADSDSQQPTERGLAACGSAEWCVHLVLAAHRGVHKRPTKRPPAPPQCCPTHQHSAQCRLHRSMVHTSSSIGGTLHMSRTKCAFQDGAAGIQQQHPTSWSVLLPWEENLDRIFKSKRVEDLDACASRSKMGSWL